MKKMSESASESKQNQTQIQTHDAAVISLSLLAGAKKNTLNRKSAKGGVMHMKNTRWTRFTALLTALIVGAGVFSSFGKELSLRADAECESDEYVFSCETLPESEPTTTPEPTVEPTAEPTVEPTTTPADAENDDPSFGDFIERLYNVALARDSEEEGKAFWLKKVTEDGFTGADCARFFLIDAKEFQNRELSDEDFVETLYQTFFDRESEEDGKAFWVEYLQDHSKTDAVNGFIDSEEWCNLCATYGIRPGADTAKAQIPSKNASAFATRLYSTCLGREPDEEGLLYWALGLTNQELLAADAANQFFMSPEFFAYEFSDEEYLDRLYKTMMDREPEEYGKAFWLDFIQNNTRYQILCEFVESPEFTAICKSYSIERGTLIRENDPFMTLTPEPTETPTPEPTATPTPTPATGIGQSDELAGMVIVIDPGHQLHGNYDTELVAPWSDERKAKVSSGTSGVSTGRPEYAVNLEIGLIVRDYLEEMGARVIMCRTENDVDISNIERAKIATDNNADVFLRLHCDSSESSEARGIGVFVCSRGELADKQVTWGNWLGNSLADSTGSRFRGCTANDTYSGLNWATSVPSFLLEMGFMSNAEDDRLLSDPTYQKQIAKGIADFCIKMKESRG